MVMRKMLICVLCISIAPTAWAQRKPAIPRDAKLETKVERVLSRMTLDEKIGQMLELNLDVMGKI